MAEYHPITGLPPRAHEAFLLWAKGKKVKEIAEDMVISERTVENHITKFRDELGLETRHDAYRYMVDNDLEDEQYIEWDKRYRKMETVKVTPKWVIVAMIALSLLVGVFAYSYPSPTNHAVQAQEIPPLPDSGTFPFSVSASGNTIKIVKDNLTITITIDDSNTN